MKKILVALTGASGLPLGIKLLDMLAKTDGIALHYIISPGARLVMEAECEKDAILAPPGAMCHQADNFCAGPASGSWWHDVMESAMVVAPCSMSTLGAIASGSGRNLIHRAADVVLKERIRLVLVSRETPLSPVHLRNMLELARAGAQIMPFSPGFYLRPQSLDEMLEQFCFRIFDQLGIKHDKERWQGN